MHPSARLKCFRGCEGVELELTAPVYRCPRCGSLLDVAHDLPALQSRSAEDWRALFRERRARPGGSGVWDRKELVAPELDPASIVSLGEGRSTLLPARRFGAALGVPDLWLKLCGNSHTGSFKDLGMTVLVSMVHDAVRRGRPIRAVGCASTGDTSAALAAYGARAELPVVVLLPRGKVSTAQLVQPIASGARVLALDGDFDACMRVIDELASRGVLYLANSMNALRLEGQKTVAFEIAEDLDWQVPDWVVVPSGNLGNGYAIYKGFQLLRDLGLTDRLPRLLLAQAERANPLYRAFRDKTAVTPVRAETTLASAIQIGNPVSAPRALRALEATNGVVEQATEEELCLAGARADRSGLYVCPHTAVALAATEKCRRAGVLAEGERVVVVSTANALKFTEWKVRYHERAIAGVDAALANPPLELPADADAVERALVG
ncbi:MAG: threonine synthase [Polyangiaceae bacterium]|nr:threonine synthase [Polyangiaceae bacterium]